MGSGSFRLMAYRKPGICFDFNVPRIAGRWLFGVVLLLCAMFQATAATPTAAQLNQARIAAIGWLVTHQKGDGSWKEASGAGVQATSAALAGFYNAGIRLGDPYTAARS